MSESESGSESDPAQHEVPSKHEVPSTKVLGIWIDPLTKISGHIDKSVPAKVGNTVRLLTKSVIKRVNKVYSPDPPLKRDEMDVDFYIDAESGDDVHNLPCADEDGLIVFVRPKKQAAQKVKRRFHSLKRTEEKTSELIEIIRDSDDENSDEDGGIDNLVDYFKDLRKDMGDLKAESALLKAETVSLKAETVRLNRSLHQEQKDRAQLGRLLRQEQEDRAQLGSLLRQEQQDRKAETARLNKSLHQEQEDRAQLDRLLRQEQHDRMVETADLNRSLLLEEENRKDENKSLKAETKQLKATIAKEREERRADVADLDRAIEQQSAKLEEYERELKNAKEQHDNDIQDISELTQKLVPIHLRILLDYSRNKILNIMKYKSWDELREGRSARQMTDMIVEAHQEENVVNHLSRGTLDFLCSYNNIRKVADRIAHKATQNEIKNAVMMEKNSQDGLRLEELYQFVFPTT